MCKVSVLMPVYNAEKYLAEAINSIISQTFTDWELVLINDGSTDESEKIIASYKDERIRYVANDGNIGLVKTLNKGIKLCKGKYIARMDSDDIAFPERLAKQVDFLDKHSNHVLVGTNAIMIDQDKKTIERILRPTSDSLLKINLLFTCPLIHPSVMMRKSALIDCVYDEEWKHTEDYELWTRLANKGEIANIDEFLLKYRWHDSNVSVKYASLQNKNRDILIKKQLLDLDIEASDEDIEIHRLSLEIYSLVKNKNNTYTTKELDDVSNWFIKLANQNKKFGKYIQSDFEAFLWSRWMVLCIVLRKKNKMYFPKFISYKPPVIWRTIKLAIYLSKK